MLAREARCDEDAGFLAKRRPVLISCSWLPFWNKQNASRYCGQASFTKLGWSRDTWN